MTARVRCPDAPCKVLVLHPRSLRRVGAPEPGRRGRRGQAFSSTFRLDWTLAANPPPQGPRRRVARWSAGPRSPRRVRPTMRPVDDAAHRGGWRFDRELDVFACGLERVPRAIPRPARPALVSARRRPRRASRSGPPTCGGAGPADDQHGRSRRDGVHLVSGPGSSHGCRYPGRQRRVCATRPAPGVGWRTARTTPRSRHTATAVPPKSIWDALARRTRTALPSMIVSDETELRQPCQAAKHLGRNRSAGTLAAL